jgi:hypothetical protein
VHLILFAGGLTVGFFALVVAGVCLEDYLAYRSQRARGDDVKSNWWSDTFTG